MACQLCGKETSGPFCPDCGARVTQPPPAANGQALLDPVPPDSTPTFSSVPNTPNGPRSSRRQVLGLKRRPAVILAVVVATASISILGAVVVKSGGAREPTADQINAGTKALQQSRSGLSLTFKDNILTAQIAPISMATRPDGSFAQDLTPLINAAMSTVWKAVPGTYDWICVEADNMKAACQDAKTLEERFGPRSDR